MEQYSIVWNSQSKNSAESMPFGGHSIGGNVWVENGLVYFYLAQSGWFDENNSMLKAGRFCISIQPNPFEDEFAQKLCLPEGCVRITGRGFEMELWAQCNDPVVHVEVRSEIPRNIVCEYQSWRFADRMVDHLSWELFQCKEVFFYPHADACFHHDELHPGTGSMVFYHQNDNADLSFDKEMEDQGLSAWKEEFFNPQKDRIMGGIADFGPLSYRGSYRDSYVDTPCECFAYASNEPIKELNVAICLRTEVVKAVSIWQRRTQRMLDQALLKRDEAKASARKYWKAFFARSYIHIDEDHPGSDAWKIGRNYNLFRYMLALNEKGFWPTKFNGGLLTFDPSLGGKSPWSDDPLKYTPDFRLWGGGSHTIQNQRLLYWPMLRAGDFPAMHQHFDFFLRILPAARRNVSVHLNAKGAMFPEQVGNYGLCCGCDNEWGNQTGLPVSQIKYHFSNSLETALMMLDYAAYTGESPAQHLDFIDAVLEFYDSFYPENDQDGHMILYPANALETYHVVKNPADAIAGLRAVLERLLKLPMEEACKNRREKWSALLNRIPELPLMEKDGKTILAPAQTTSIIHNCELPQLYSVHPYGLYGLGKPGLELARDTMRIGPETEEQLTHISWHPTGVMYARLGMVDEAWDFLMRKLGDGPFRFPAFWGPGHDWTPDHNWGGSGMLQLQEMLLQTGGDGFRILPCWPEGVDVRFRLYAPGNTMIECEFRDGKVRKLEAYSGGDIPRLICPELKGEDRGTNE